MVRFFLTCHVEHSYRQYGTMLHVTCNKPEVIKVAFHPLFFVSQKATSYKALSVYMQYGREEYQFHHGLFSHLFNKDMMQV